MILKIRGSVENNKWFFIDNVETLLTAFIGKNEISMEDFWGYDRCFDLNNKNKEKHEGCPEHIQLLVNQDFSIGATGGVFLLNDSGKTVEVLY